MVDSLQLTVGSHTRARLSWLQTVNCKLQTFDLIANRWFYYSNTTVLRP